MRLFLNETEGTGMIACPACGLPLLLAAERRGRWVVGYSHLYLRVGRAAMLVCPDVDCHHKEDVTIAGESADAVVYSSGKAASLWRTHSYVFHETLGDMRDRLEHLSDLYERTGNPKLPSAYRYWRDHYESQYSLIVPQLRHSLEEQSEVTLYSKNAWEQGRIIEIFPDSVLVDRSHSNQTVLIPFGDIHRVSRFARFWSRKVRLDFSDGADTGLDNHCVHTPTQFAMISGRRVILETVDRHGNCRIKTDDPEVARALGLRLRVQNEYSAVVPAGMFDRCFTSVRWCYVLGFRLLLRSHTMIREIVQLQTRNMEAAQVLKMRRRDGWFLRERRQLRWWRYFHKNEIDRTEEKQIPLDISRLIRDAQRRYAAEQALEARMALEAADWEDEEEWEEVESDEAPDTDDSDS